MEAENLWMVAGMAYSLVGAALLCNAVFKFSNPAAVIPTAVRGQSRLAMKLLIERWLDSRAGAVLLVIGFFLQITGALGTQTLNKPAIFLLLGLAAAAAYYGLMRDLMVENVLDRAAGQTRSAAPAQTIRELPAPVPVITVAKVEVPTDAPATIEVVSLRTAVGAE